MGARASLCATAATASWPSRATSSGRVTATTSRSTSTHPISRSSRWGPSLTPLHPTLPYSTFKQPRSAPPCLISPSPILPHPTPPFLKLSDNIAFAPLNVAYPQLPGQLETAGLDPTRNLWFAPYDFNDEERTGKNWRLLAEEEEEGLWCPLGECEAVIPRVEAGSIEVPTDDTGEAHPSPRDAPSN